MQKIMFEICFWYLRIGKILEKKDFIFNAVYHKNVLLTTVFFFPKLLVI